MGRPVYIGPNGATQSPVRVYSRTTYVRCHSLDSTVYMRMRLQFYWFSGAARRKEPQKDEPKGGEIARGAEHL